MRTFAGCALLLAASSVTAAPLTVRNGESWVFTLKDGEPVNAHKTEGSAKPPKGQIMVSVRALFGTTLIATNNSAVGYTFNAELVPGKNLKAVRTCTLPANAKPILEQWDQKAEAVRLSNFRAAGNEGRC